MLNTNDVDGVAIHASDVNAEHVVPELDRRIACYILGFQSIEVRGLQIRTEGTLTLVCLGPRCVCGYTSLRGGDRRADAVVRYAREACPSVPRCELMSCMLARTERYMENI